jgi:PAS domain S-box-containing protein
MAREITILHVDDDESFGVFVRDWLEGTAEDLRVTTVRSAEAALERLASPDHGFDVVVSDYCMPETTGLELFERVRERDSKLPFVLFTGQGSEAIARDALTAGVTDYVQKSNGSDSLSLLTRRVRSVVEQRHLDAEAKRYDALVELLDIAVFVFEADGRLVSFNDSFAELVGHDRSDLRSGYVWSLPPISERDLLEQYVGNLVGEDGPDMVSFRLSVRAGSGEIHPCRVDLTAVPGWDGEPESYVGILRDLTERERFRLTLTDLLGWAAGPYMALDREWRITMLNEPAEQLLGATESGLVGRSLWGIYPAFEDSSFHDRLASVAETAEPDEFSTYYGPTAQHFLVRSYPTSTGLAVYFRDVTDSVERERELEFQRQRLAEFASVVSHDLRSPLAVVRGRLTLLRDDLEADEATLDAIDRALERAEAIIDDTLSFAEDVEIDDLGPVDLEKIAERAWEITSVERGTIEVGRGPTIRADGSGIQRVLENLLRNSVDHADGPVKISIDWIESDETTTGFYVEDDGPGIPTEIRDSVFDPGVTTREDGTGLGLAIVRQIVLSHGWSIRVTEGESGGARFEISGVDPIHDPIHDRSTSTDPVRDRGTTSDPTPDSSTSSAEVKED